MKILFHCNEFPPQAGGVGTYIRHMGSALVHLGHDVVVVTSRVEGLPETEILECGVIYRVYDSREMRSTRVRELVLHIAKEHSSDLIEGADHLGETAGLISVRERPPVLVKVHGSNPIRIIQAAQVLYPWQRVMISLAQWRNLGQSRAERYSIERADLLQVPSQRLLDELKKQGFRLPRHVGVISNSITPVRLTELREDSVPTLLFPARLEIRKGIEFLPSLVRRISEHYPDMQLLIAGDDSYARGLGSMREWLLKRMGNDSLRVKFLGKLSASEMDSVYRRAWVVILPTRWDNCPMVILEAMVRGKAIVTSPHGGMPEMLAETSCRIARPETEEFSDAVLAFLRNSHARHEAGTKGRERALSVYGPISLARQYIDFVRSAGISGTP